MPDELEQPDPKFSDFHHDADALQVLDFTEAETAIVNALLEKGSQSVSKLGTIADVPRTTVYSALKRLKERGLVRRASRGYASVWELVPPTKLKQELSSSFGYLDRDSTAEELERALGTKTTENKTFFVFSGIEAMFQVYQWLIINHFQQTVCRVQPYTAVAAMFGRLHHEKIAQLNDILKDNKVTSSLILSEKAKALYWTALCGKSRLAGSLERDMKRAHVVPDNLLPFHTELVIGKNMALFVDWKEYNLVLIKHQQMVKFLKGVFALLLAQDATQSDIATDQ